MTRLATSEPQVLAHGVLAGERRALARAITLIESTRPDHRATAEAMLEHLLPHTGASVRIGISGVPGVGKSTFIEAFGLHVIGRGHKVAVLAVDPSSPRSGGSILGDKTRMEELSRDERAFIRPSPSGGTLGGVARRTREALLACEAAGFDVIIVETVGVGIKKGIVEIADTIIVNKADGDLANAAKRAARDYQNALHLLRPASRHWAVPVLSCSAVSGLGITEVWDTVCRYRQVMGEAGELAARRDAQAQSWMWNEISENLTLRFRTHPKIGKMLAEVEGRVASGQATPTAAAQTLLNAFLENT